MQHWSRLDIKEGEPCPVKRSGHAAVCLGYGGDHPQLLVTGGSGGGNKVLSDVWILDIQSRRWKEVRLYGMVSQDRHFCHTTPADFNTDSQWRCAPFPSPMNHCT